MAAFAQLTKHGIIVIIRGLHPDDAPDVAEALYAGGIRLLEITMNSEAPLTAIRAVADVMAGRMVIGAGTVLNARMVEEAVTAGAEFVLSPIVCEEVIQTARQLGVVAVPGAYTPTEVYRAHQAGADIVKIFPATSPGYIRDIAGPLPQVPLLPTGGINLQNICDYKAAGAVGFGIGSALVDTKKAITPQYLAEITAKARQFVEAIAVP
ncbi:2-dehydro-3-deoxyphosphogluconate aldolase / (4S)-4-hydroxy-2-oxoglutarate aldolase [Parapedobacter composti]|uniref:2-dehydro-3-deoxyphosphogluconate aldolase / (4S)-4-hydroxy-2-oxoglutarate aldolase n=1 Tax=Parapedobacter composti TaxID=623281 RepID=A0A1I1HA33_9SPHI|nr:bifunctional 4-hydroxy-2-oxoglutarate aldolase/2-dehydro-3-deoxy-phosphogluconate aldolase [Parapedobacter composti]SFC20824.1 2-dehydro-3-deoxyphosphogluconate aldolase / (4S)-4-hydroxy-2-oxoglutarate aldolase [Parapedobacter composti]